MLESLVAWVLNTYLGEYVENLNTDQLSIALLQGAVELENLTLKKDALSHLELPIELKSGVIGKVSLQIPITLLRSEKWVIRLEKLYVVAGPLKNDVYNEEKEKKAHQSMKAKMLKALEKQWKIEDKEVEAKSSWFSFGSSMASSILENLQVIVKDVHIRYEDESLCPGGPIACGVKISSLSAQSTDISWVPTFINNCSSEMMHKLVDLQDFSVYWDVAASLIDSSTEFKLMINMDMDSHCNEQVHEYILGPVTAKAKMRRNTSDFPLRSPDAPRLSFDISMDRIPAALSDDQYHGVLKLVKRFEHHDIRRAHRKHRPNVTTIKGNARVWWVFAIQCHLSVIKERNRRLTRAFIVQRVSDIMAYHHAYCTELVNTYVDTNMKMVMSKIEENLTFAELKILRELAFNKVLAEGRLPKPKPSRANKPDDGVTDSTVAVSGAPQGAGLFHSWFPGWAGWYSTPTEPGVSTPQTPKSPELLIEKEIMDVLSDFAESDTLLKRDLVFAVLNFSLNSGSFKLNSSGSLPHSAGVSSLIEVECTTIKMQFESRPRTKAMLVSLSLGGLYVTDRVTKGTLFPYLVSPQNKSRTSLTADPSPPTLFSNKSPPKVADEDPMFTFLWEARPSGMKAHYRLVMKMKPLDIVYNAETVNITRDFFMKKFKTTSKAGGRSNFFLTRARIEQLKMQTKAELLGSVDRLEGDGVISKTRWDVHLDIAAPQIIVPEDVLSPDTPLVIFDLGHLRFDRVSSPAAGGQSDKLDPLLDTTMDEDDEFATPCTSPQGEMEEGNDDGVKVTDAGVKVTDAGVKDEWGDVSEMNIMQRLYDRYTLELTDVQVKVCRVRDHWRMTNTRGTSHLHAVDKFSISVLFERRLVFTTDPKMPSVILSGNITNLTLHLDEQKMKSLKTCISRLTATESASKVAPENNPSESNKDEHKEETTSNILAASATTIGRELLNESKLLVVQFTINETSLQIHSRGMSLAELRVEGMRANLSKYPSTLSVNFSIHSLLVVDAIQTFGPDFELLVASHRNLSLDKTSGSMCDSDPASPASPQSPVNSPIPFNSQQTMYSALSTAFSASKPNSDRKPRTVDEEALISIDIELISPVLCV